jgi:ZIP family zinc transporter
MQEFSPILQALIAGCFTWGLTALGATMVFFTKAVRGKLLDSMLGFAGGRYDCCQFLVFTCSRY